MASWVAVPLIVAAVALAYSNSLQGPFILDDELSVVGNPAIRPGGDLLQQPANTPIAGRPVAALTFAFNFALHQLDVGGYHAANIAIHIACALLIFAVVRATLQLPRLTRRYGECAFEIGLMVAVIWAVHPLNSEAVNYITQRTESLMALWYLATIYASLRSLQSTQPSWWQGLGVVSCALGMGTKESMVTAPVIIALFDRAFVFDSWREALERRHRFYIGLATTWLVLAALALSGPRAASAGFSTLYESLVYLLNQSAMIVRYLKLSIWPTDLVVFYGPVRPIAFSSVMPHVVFLMALVIFTAIMFRRYPPLGFVGAWFFITLAPASSIMPIATEVGAERRMYLPLAAIAVLFVLAAHWAASRWKGAPRWTTFAAAGVVVTALAAATRARGIEYADPLVLAETTLKRWPNDATHSFVGSELARVHRDEEAIPHLRIAARTMPRARYNLAGSLFNTGRLAESVMVFKGFIADHPSREEVPLSHRAIGEAYGAERRWSDAIGEFETALKMKPQDAQARRLLVHALEQQGLEYARGGRLAEAIAVLRRGAELDPNRARLHHNLAAALLDTGNHPAAEQSARRAIALEPSQADSRALLARALALKGDYSASIAEFRRAAALDPGNGDIQQDLARVLQARKRENR